MKKIRIEALIDNLPQVLGMIDEELEAVNCPLRVQTQIDVAAEEIYVNIASYAYAPGTGMAEVSIDVKQSVPPVAVLTFDDEGVAFDPLKKPDPDITLSAAERAIGGLGIYMVKNTMDDVKYERKDNHNVFTIVKNLTED